MPKRGTVRYLDACDPPRANAYDGAGGRQESESPSLPAELCSSLLYSFDVVTQLFTMRLDHLSLRSNSSLYVPIPASELRSLGLIHASQRELFRLLTVIGYRKSVLGSRGLFVDHL